MSHHKTLKSKQLLPMAAFFPKTENSANFTPHKERFNRVFQPIETLDHPCDVTLVFEDGKEFKAHKDVLSEASPFFEKLLNSDMKESKEGVVRLEMFNESVMAAALEFIYRIYSIKRPGRLLNFWTSRVGAYSRWALIRGWALIKFSPFVASSTFILQENNV